MDETEIDYYVKEPGSTVWHAVPKWIRAGHEELTCCGVAVDSLDVRTAAVASIPYAGEQCSVCASERATTVRAGRISLTLIPKVGER